MTQITISDTRSGHSSKYAPVYQEIDNALREKRDLVLQDFRSLKSAILLYGSIRRNYRDVAYIGIAKYGHNGAIAPVIAISPRYT